MLNPKTKQRELCYVVKIDKILPIEGAERVEQAVVGGWHIMVRKGQFNVGDYAVYFEIDSKVPQREPYMFLKDKHFKIKTQKYFKGTVISQGLLMSFDDFEGEQVIEELKLDMACEIANGIDPLDEPKFLTKELGVVYSVEEDNKRKANINKYNKMYQRHLGLFKKHKILRKMFKYELGKKILFIFLGKKRDTRNWPAWVEKTDEERIENLPQMFLDKQPWIATEKIDGTSTTFTIKKKGKKFDFYVCSRNVNFDKPEKECYYDTNVYLEMADKYNVENVLIQLFEVFPKAEWITLQGETYGAGIQKRDYHLQDHKFMGFNLIISNEGRLNSRTAADIMKNYGIEWVPILDENYILPDTLEELRAFVDSEGSRVDGEIKEGIVFRSLDGTQSFKCVSPDFLIKYHQ